jgi:hypothetical protein
MKLADALKEWQVAVNALEQGETMLLLRKGGIREVGGKFAVQRDRVWLYPTFEHQKPELLKPHYAHRVEPVASGWHPETVRISAWAEVSEVFPVQDEAAVMALLPFHIWNEAFVRERLQWKPTQPILVLALRVYRLEQAQIIPYTPAYGGCKSWIELEPAIATEPSHPVIADASYHTQLDGVRSLLK